EMQPWTFDYALQSYHFAFILALGGGIVALYRLFTTKENGYLFILVWTLITFYITIKHMRFEFFVAVPFAVLSSFCISYAYTNYFSDFTLYLKKEEKTPVKSKKAKAEKKNPLGAAVFAFAAIITILFFANSLINDVNFATDYSGVSFEKDKWIEAMEWMNGNTPSPGVDYFGEYSPDTFTYPDDSYGVMSWWDFGHAITLIGKRIPVSNPFQDNVAGDTGCADFLMAEAEDAANRIMDNADAKFVVTNSELTTPQKGILTILSWLNQADIVNDYLIYINMPDDSGNPVNTICYTPDYYNSMIVRLESLDGTYIKPAEASVLTTKTISGVKSVVSYETMDYDKAVLEAVSDDKMLVSADSDEPCCTLPALKHYRLVYE
ncbi:MAG: hypothetical protein PHV39_10530, partial [Methanomicrobium sp.]|nr:hypothetical protein [Methanomicrobium sp.]